MRVDLAKSRVGNSKTNSYLIDLIIKHVWKFLPKSHFQASTAFHKSYLELRLL